MERPCSKVLLLAFCLLTVSTAASNALAQADVALCVLHQTTKWGTVGDMTAYSIGTTSVNVGTTNLNWIQNGVNHPVISQNMFKLENGTFEQIGQSWLKHSFCALQISSACDSGCPNQGGCLSFLAPGCQDPYSAPRNGSQSLLGPKYQVNAHTGQFTWPHPTPSGGTLGGRLQVHNTDLGRADAIYFIEGQYVALDDATAGNQNNNGSYRMVSISAAPTYNIGFVSGQSTQFRRSAIRAWQSHGNGVNMPDPGVIIETVDDPTPINGGRFFVGYKVSDNGDGTWHYEYAIQNMNHHGSGRSFTVPIGSGVTVSNIGFHDVDYHSGDGAGGVNYDGTDWAVTVGANSITWETASEAENANANALRWATLYNFRFDADSGPTDAAADIGIYRTPLSKGDPTSLTVDIQGPGDLKVEPCPWDLDGSGDVGINDLLDLLADWNNPWIITDLLDLLAAWGPCPM